MNVAEIIQDGFTSETVLFLQSAGNIAAEADRSLYLVGGSVRDLLLKRSIVDLDCVVDGDAIQLAPELASHLNGEILTTSEFGTAKITFGEHVVDLTSARKETYKHPGALPAVRAGTIRDDLMRRDFSINAVAICLEPRCFGEILDVTGGVMDIQMGLVRVLHGDSFRDDATRILRAVRYEQRLGFCLGDLTESLICRDLSYLDTISPDRMRHELDRVLGEEAPLRIMLRLDELGILQEICPSLHGKPEFRKVLEEASTSNIGSPLVYIALLSYWLSIEHSEQFIQRLNMTAKQSNVVRDIQKVKALIGHLGRSNMKPSQIHCLLETIALEAVHGCALALSAGIARRHLLRYVQDWYHIEPILSGRDLIRIGIVEGPVIGAVLRELKRARLDGLVSSRADEEAVAIRYVSTCFPEQ